MLLETARLEPFVTWAAPIAAAVLTCLGQALVAMGQRRINLRMDEEERKHTEARAKTEEKRRLEAEWRESIDTRLKEQDEKMDAVISAQCTQMRSDLVHRAHHYVGVAGCASMDEKQSFYAEWQEYTNLCAAHGIQNSFIDNIVKQVMALPDTPSGDVTPSYMQF